MNDMLNSFSSFQFGPRDNDGPNNGNDDNNEVVFVTTCTEGADPFKTSETGTSRNSK